MKAQAQTKDEWREWINKNPLKVWKEKYNVYTLNELASRLGTSILTVNAWLLGMQMPRDERMARVTKITGVTQTELRTWYNSRP